MISCIRSLNKSSLKLPSWFVVLLHGMAELTCRVSLGMCGWLYPMIYWIRILVYRLPFNPVVAGKMCVHHPSDNVVL